ncbi:unnamed protein product [Closterium sp. NIES-53]
MNPTTWPPLHPLYLAVFPTPLPPNAPQCPSTTSLPHRPPLAPTAPHRPLHLNFVRCSAKAAAAAAAASSPPTRSLSSRCTPSLHPTIVR